jgi:hypothetical protein
MSEREIQHAIREALGLEPGVCLWRNQVGQYTEERGGRKRVIRTGLAVGSADLVGIVDGRFFALETKSPTGRPTAEQSRWLQLVRNMGGFACVVRSADEARAALARARAGACE